VTAPHERHTCRHCSPPTQTTTEPEPAAPAPIELPAEPRPFRVHLDDRTQDCTLHPDGTITSVMAGNTYQCALTFEGMREIGGWGQAHIEWDPTDPPAPKELAPAPQVIGVEQTGLFQ
jgi:hypothetical protein